VVSSTIETDAKARLAEVVGADNLLTGDDVGEDYGHDETLQVVGFDDGRRSR